MDRPLPRSDEARAKSLADIGGRAMAAAWRPALAVVLLAIAAWGARVIWLDVLRYAGSRPFGGDFGEAMEIQLANPRSVVYGPIFLIESWLRTRWPDVFSITAFALANVPLIVVAFVASVLAARLRPFLILAALAGWLAPNLLAIALLDVANPEILELTLVCLAWLAASRGRRIAEGSLISLAWMTKLVPVIFVLQLLVRREVRALGAVVAVAAVLTAVVAIGIGLSPLEAITLVLVPFGPYGTSLALPLFETTTFAGLSSALGRVILGGEVSGTERFSYDELLRFRYTLHYVAIAVAVVLIGAASWSAHSVLRSLSLDRTLALGLAYSIFVAILPVVSLAAHPHTFVLLLPAITGIVLALAADAGPRRLIFGGAIAPAYVLVGVPLVPTGIDRVLGTSLVGLTKNVEPIWPALWLAVVMIAYGIVLARRAGHERQATAGAS
ncbi:MAG: DUF2029 domain-containing protein [Elusimicrobia bacterium]|nr:DUF2029 domain-containing protein [Elusimicrobiota bacterium]